MGNRFIDQDGYIQIGSYFRRWRLEAGITQEETAELLGVSTQFVSNSERGSGTYPLKAMRTLVEAYNIPVSSFLKFMDEVQSKSLRRALGNPQADRVSSASVKKSGV
jgi:transcriptional regulator with XRE-family HTH domain